MRLYDIHSLLFGTPAVDWLAIDDAYARLVERIAKLGYDGGLDRALAEWAGTENLEERLDGTQKIDPVVLSELRERG